jgi:ABC-type Mn2+/Zn2+ transport system permease subunit
MLMADSALVLSSWDRVLEALSYYQMQIGASALIGTALGVMGAFVVLRRMALVGDALSHAVLPGVVVAFILIDRIVGNLDGWWGVWGLFLGALIAGLITALSIGWVSKRARAKEDSAVGIVFTAMFGLGVIMISLQPEGTHFDLTCYLFGDPLAIQRQDFHSILIVTPLVLLFVTVGFRALKMISFDPQISTAMGLNVDLIHYIFMGFLAATVVAALRTVGVIMSVAMLITPAAAAYQLTNRLSVMLVLSGLIGGLSAVLGFLLAFALNIPTGPAMVLVATTIFLATLVFGIEYGLLGRWLRTRKIRAHIMEEDLLKILAGDPERRFTLANCVENLGNRSGGGVRGAFGRLEKKGMVQVEDANVRLTDQGKEHGLRMVRSHRLWESYLAKEGVDMAYIHDQAERLEHAHELAEDISEQLDNPSVDPHGEPIPERRG